MPEEKKEAQEPRVPPVGPVVIEVIGDVDVVPQTAGVTATRKE